MPDLQQSASSSIADTIVMLTEWLLWPNCSLIADFDEGPVWDEKAVMGASQHRHAAMVCDCSHSPIQGR